MQDKKSVVYYTYIIKCTDDSLYTGITTDLKRRFSEHAQGGKPGAKYTRSRKVEGFEAVWSAPDRASASRLEYHIKALPRQKKLLLISGLHSDDFDFFGCKREDINQLIV